jgi:hypothetical protein
MRLLKCIHGYRGDIERAAGYGRGLRWMAGYNVEWTAGDGGEYGWMAGYRGGYWEAARYRRWYREAAVMCLRPGRERLRIRCVGILLELSCIVVSMCLGVDILVL